MFAWCFFVYVYYSLYKFQYRYVDFLRKDAVTDINFVYDICRNVVVTSQK